MTIYIAKDFTIKPGPRTIKEGNDSGELFLNKILRAAFKNSLAEKEILVVNLDNTAGYATSFLEESFGGLQRENPKLKLEEHMKFISHDEPYLLDEIQEYITNARS